MFWQPTLPGEPAGSDPTFLSLQQIGLIVFCLLCLPTTVISTTVLVSMRWKRSVRRFGFGHILCLSCCAVSTTIYAIVFSELVLTGHIEAAWIFLQFHRWLTVFTTCSLITFHVIVNRVCSGIEFSKRSFLSKILPETSDNWYMISMTLFLALFYTPITILYTLAPRNINYPTQLPLLIPVILDFLFYLTLIGMWSYYALSNYRNLSEEYRKYVNFWPNLWMILISLCLVTPRMAVDGFFGNNSEAEWAQTEMIFVFMSTLVHHLFVYIWAGVPFYYIITGRVEKLRYSGIQIKIFHDGEHSTEPRRITSSPETQEVITQYWDKAFEEKRNSSVEKDSEVFTYLPKTWCILLKSYQEFLEDIREPCERLNKDQIFLNLGQDLKIYEFSSDGIVKEFQEGNYGLAYLHSLEELIQSDNQNKIISRFPEMDSIRNSLNYK